MAEVYIKCPKCDLNYITKKEKICATCKQKMKTASLTDSGKMAELGLCPICKVNYITEDETVCSTCYAETDLTDEEISEMYGKTNHEDLDDGDDDGDDDHLNTVEEEGDDLDLTEDEDLELLNVAGIDNEENLDDDAEADEMDDEDLEDLDEEPLTEDDEFDDDDDLDDDEEE